MYKGVNKLSYRDGKKDADYAQSGDSLPTI